MSNTQLWSQLLSEAPTGSVLMGGAVVDALLELEPKDYDIFHPYKLGLPKVPGYWQLILPDEAPDPQYTNDENFIGWCTFSKC